MTDLSIGDISLQNPYETHAMKTTDSAVLVCWVNSGDVAGDYYFIADDNASTHGSKL